MSCIYFDAQYRFLGEILRCLSPAGLNSTWLCRTPSRVVENKNVEWVGAPGAWTVYLGFIFIAWLLVLNFVPPGLVRG